MLIRSLHNGHSLVVGGQTFQAVAPGIFEVPEAIGRALVAFPHFEEAHIEAPIAANGAQDTQEAPNEAQDAQGEQSTKGKTGGKKSGGKKG